MLHALIWIVGFLITPRMTIKDNGNRTHGRILKWKTYEKFPDDPSLSCYMEKDGTWKCTESYALYLDSNPDLSLIHI